MHKSKHWQSALIIITQDKRNITRQKQGKIQDKTSKEIIITLDWMQENRKTRQEHDKIQDKTKQEQAIIMIFFITIQKMKQTRPEQMKQK